MLQWSCAWCVFPVLLKVEHLKISQSYCVIYFSCAPPKKNSQLRRCISVKLKIRISQLIAKILLRQRRLNQTRYCLTGHIQISHHFFLINKKLKYFNDFQNRNFSLLWLKWTQTMKIKKNQTFFKHDIIFHWLQNAIIFQWLL